MGGLPASLPGDVEADHPAVAVAHGQLGDLGRVGGVAHGREERADREVGAGAAEPEALEHRLHHLVGREPALDVQLGGEAHLGVHDRRRRRGPRRTPPPPGSSASFVCITADGVGEGLEVELEVAGGRRPR